MKLLALVVVIALNLVAQDPATKIGCLIGPDAKMVYGIDVERYQNSKLAQIYPIWFGQNFNSLPSVKKVIGTLSDPSGGHSPALILQGTSFSAQTLSAQPGQESLMRTYQGFPAVALSSESMLVVLSTTLAVKGETDSISHVIDRWNSTDCTGGLIARIDDLNNSYDAWFAILRPIEQINAGNLMPESPHREELAQSIEEVHGGIRIGAIHSVKVELTTKDPDDASALAVLARWLPAMLEKEDSTEGHLIGLVQNFETRSSGRTASLSFLLPESGVEAALTAPIKRFDFRTEQ